MIVNYLVASNDKDELYTSTTNINKPLPAITRVVNTSKASKRYVSSREVH